MNEFEEAYNNLTKRFNYPEHFAGALIEVNDTLSFAKKILLSNRVQQFSATDVLELTRLIIGRESVLFARAERERDEDE